MSGTTVVIDRSDVEDILEELNDLSHTIPWVRENIAVGRLPLIEKIEMALEGK